MHSPGGTSSRSGRRSFDKLPLRQASASRRYGKAEIRILPTVDVGDLRRRGDELARERRELDTVIQETNWTTELIE